MFDRPQVRSALLLIGAVVIVAGLVYARNEKVITHLFSKPCASPITVTVGTVDPRFGETRAEVEAALIEAAVVWNKAAGKMVLAYAPNDASAIPVNLVYDERQQAITLGAHLDMQKQSLDSSREELTTLQARFDTAKTEYEAALGLFETKEAAYTADVERINRNGGATEAQYAAFKSRSTQLKQEERVLNAQAQSLNALAATLKVQVNNFNQGVQSLNLVVDTFNTSTDKDFDAGKYIRTATSTRITIYSFSSRKEFVFELAHEFGHALGIDHNDNVNSIMYPYAKAGALVLSPEDLAALRLVCDLDS
jgi:hypothetical protein